MKAAHTRPSSVACVSRVSLLAGRVQAYQGGHRAGLRAVRQGESTASDPPRPAPPGALGRTLAHAIAIY